MPETRTDSWFPDAENQLRERPDPFESSFARSIFQSKYQMHPGESWHGLATRVVKSVLAAVGMEDTEEARRLVELVYQRKLMLGGRYNYAAGRDLHQVQNCSLYRADDTREGWADLMQKVAMSLMTGAGVGVWYGDVREDGAEIRRTGGVASGPISLMKIINEIGRNVMQGGARRSAIWAGLPWWHPDVFKFITAKDWSDDVRALRKKDFTFPADLDMTNISVTLDDAFFQFIEDGGHTSDERHEFYSSRGRYAPDGRSWEQWAEDVFRQTVAHMVTTAEPGFSVDVGDNAGENLRNACTEITSADDSDICNLGSVVLSRIESIEELEEATDLGTLLLIAGTVYSHLPHEEVHATREKNRRLGLGHMGVAEWLLQRGKPYGPDPELATWMDVYEQTSDRASDYWADLLGVSRPVKKRAIAPNGTIGILAETTTSAEPMFSAAYKRRVRNAAASGDTIEYEYVVDPVAARHVANGGDPSIVEDAYSLAYQVERRVAMQAWLQQWVDHGISSTVNLPYVMDDPQEQKEFGDMLLRYLPKLRGITCYPDGSRGGQPLTSVPLEFALGKTGVRYEENEEACVGGLCGV